jgi:hypothetical protein
VSNSNRKFNWRRLLALAALFFLAWFLWQLFGPSAPIIDSKETTHIVAPLRPDGLPDYVTHLSDKSRAGVTQENNAAVLMWQVFGPGQQDSAIDASHWQQIVKEFQLPTNNPNSYFEEPLSEPTATLVGDWLYENSPDWKRAEAAPINPDYPLLTHTDLGYESITRTMNAPWRAADLPPLAEWVEVNNDAIDLLVEASQRPKLYTPLELPAAYDKHYLIATMPMNGIMRSRATARVLIVRAMFHLGEGRHAEAWQDLLAIHRWARLIAQGPTTVDQLVGVAVDGIACHGDAALLASGDLPLNVARQIHEDLSGLAPVANLAVVFDQGERLYFLDAIVAYRKRGVGNLVADNFFIDLETGKSKDPDWREPLLNRVSADWNVGLAEGNRWFDRLAAAAQLPKFTDRKQEISRIESEIRSRESTLRKPKYLIAAAFSYRMRNDLLATAMIAAFSPSFRAAMEAIDRGQATLELTQLTAALAVYRAEHNEYPDRLDQLVPDVLPQLPLDLYHDKPFVYQRTADGYLLYSCGPNGNDDGGSGQFSNTLAGRPIDSLPESDQAAAQEKIPGSADDISIRVPTPPFKLPETTRRPVTVGHSKVLIPLLCSRVLRHKLNRRSRA